MPLLTKTDSDRHNVCVADTVPNYEQSAFKSPLGTQSPREELVAKLSQAEEEKVDAAQLAHKFEALSEENRTLKLAQSQCVEQLEKLRIQFQKRQGSS
ncbi:MAP3K7 C-terminal-like protein [Molossus molossus]|uniref:MAP3K7 C-terminal-like protein n=1 Tax=Molossus molossus TaxID=27622 RepID=UPI00174688A2|nr:MAP3K7 C-terminal-like protein [Molossus molossus]